MSKTYKTKIIQTAMSFQISVSQLKYQRWQEHYRQSNQPKMRKAKKIGQKLIYQQVNLKPNSKNFSLQVYLSVIWSPYTNNFTLFQTLQPQTENDNLDPNAFLEKLLRQNQQAKIRQKRVLRKRRRIKLNPLTVIQEHVTDNLLLNLMQPWQLLQPMIDDRPQELIDITDHIVQGHYYCADIEEILIMPKNQEKQEKSLSNSPKQMKNMSHSLNTESNRMQIQTLNTNFNKKQIRYIKSNKNITISPNKHPIKLSIHQNIKNRLTKTKNQQKKLELSTISSREFEQQQGITASQQELDGMQQDKFIKKITKPMNLQDQ